MGNSLCCQGQIGSKLDLTQITIAPSCYSVIQNYLHEHPIIDKVLRQNENLQQQYSSIKKLMFKNSKQYAFSDGIFIGKVAAENNKKIGYGIMMYKNGNYYEGQWKDDVKQGTGIFVNQEGNFYYGQWRNDLADGHGIFQQIKTKSLYKGQWKAGQKNGKGMQNYEDGSSYNGDFVNGMKHGMGKLIYSNETWYEGSFINNSIQGNGIFKGKNHIYEGGWKQGKMYGTGKSQWYNQRNQVIAKYIGEYKNGIKQGFGQYTDSKGTTYKAIWIDGQINQKGPIVAGSPKNLYD